MFFFQLESRYVVLMTQFIDTLLAAYSSRLSSIQSKNEDILVYTPGIPIPHIRVPKLTNPTW